MSDTPEVSPLLVPGSCCPHLRAKVVGFECGESKEHKQITLEVNGSPLPFTISPVYRCPLDPFAFHRPICATLKTSNNYLPREKT